MPVNRADASRAKCPFGGNWPGSNRTDKRDRPVLPRLLQAPDLGIKSSRSPCSLGQDFASVSDLRAVRRRSEAFRTAEAARNSVRYALSVVGSTWTPGPMVELTATRLT